MKRLPLLVAAAVLTAAFMNLSSSQVVATPHQEHGEHGEQGEHEEHGEHGEHGERAEHGEHENPLHEAMETVEDNLHLLRKSLKDESRASESLAAIVRMQAALLICKTSTPPMAEDLKDGASEEFMLAFRLTFIAFGQELLTLEEQVLQGEHKKARATYKRIREFEDRGHERFTED